MNGIGIKKSSGIEIVDATVVNGSIFPSQCPGDLRISCNACSHAWTADVVAIKNSWRKGRPFPFMVCHWHDARPDERVPFPGTRS